MLCMSMNENVECEMIGEEKNNVLEIIEENYEFLKKRKSDKNEDKL